MQAWDHCAVKKSRQRSGRASRGRSHGTKYSHLNCSFLLFVFTDIKQISLSGPKYQLTLQDLNTSSSSRCASACCYLQRAVLEAL